LTRELRTPPHNKAQRGLSSGTRIAKKADRLGNFTRDKRILLIAVMALPISTVGTLVAYALLWLINTITNLCLRTLLEHLRAINPFVHRCFEQICDAVGTAEFSDVVK
jgi:hypothetical protein